MAVAIYPGTLSACMHCLTVLNSTAKLLGSPYSMHAAVAPRCGRQLASTAAQIALLEPTKAGARLKTSGGASHRLVDDAENGLAASVLTAPLAGPLTDAALFIDQNAQQLKTTARARVPQACLLCVSAVSAGIRSSDAIPCVTGTQPVPLWRGCAERAQDACRQTHGESIVLEAAHVPRRRLKSSTAGGAAGAGAGGEDGALDGVGVGKLATS